MLKNFYWPVEFSHNVTNKPLELQALGQRFVLWRDTKGKVNCLSDLCIHRGGALSAGWLKDDAVVCPYHGWEFNGDGDCIKIPAQPHRGIPKKARVDAYPVVEKYGWVWAFLGDLPEEERPPIPDIPELEDPQFRRVTGQYYWDVNYERAVENAMDPSHAAFVHGNRFGDPDNPIIHDFEVTLTDWSGLAQIKLAAPAKNLKGKWGRLVKKQGGDIENLQQGTAGDDPMPTKAGYYLPNINILHVPLPIGNMYLIDANVPIDENHTKSMFIGLRDFIKSPWADKDTIKRIHYIFKQDDDVINKQRPEMVPFNLTDEMHVRSDSLQVAYRRRRNELIEKGWGIDMHQIVGDGPRDVAYVIPSPARKNNPELARAWVHKEVDSAHKLGKETTAIVGDGSKGGDAFFEVDEATAQEMRKKDDAASAAAKAATTKNEEITS
jgi:phenylpropionate dioxygenase-like ring-hydroxylating dioxygenase large terminal subunit